MTSRDGHRHFDDIAALLTDPVDRDGRPAFSGGRLSRPLLGEVLSRVAVKTPPRAARAEIAGGTMLRHQLPLSEGSVSKAVSTLLDRGFLEDAEEDSVADRKRGRPGAPVALSRSRWFSIGVHVGQRRGRPTSVTAVATTLDDRILGVPVTVSVPVPDQTSSDWPSEAVATAILAGVDEVVGQREIQDRRDGSWLPLLGVGVEVGAHVHHGIVVVDGKGFQLGDALTAVLDMPVVVENDANALAVRETYGTTAEHHDFALVVVADEGVGSALVLGGRVYRGSGGMAGEIGHLPAPPPDQPGVRDAPGFADKCSCGQRDHVDVYATPQRIATALGVDNPDTAQWTNGNPAFAEDVFAAAGRALGHGVATLVNVANPHQVIIQLPPLLHENGPAGSLSARYRDAVAGELKRAFSTGGRTGISLRPPADSRQLAVMGARAASVRVFIEFLDHLAGIDGCATSEKSLAAWLVSGRAAVVGGAVGAVTGGYIAGPAGAALGGIAVSRMVTRLAGPRSNVGKMARITWSRRQRLIVYRRD